VCTTCQDCFLAVHRAGFEPATSGLQVQHATVKPLSHTLCRRRIFDKRADLLHEVCCPLGLHLLCGLTWFRVISHAIFYAQQHLLL